MAEIIPIKKMLDSEKISEAIKAKKFFCVWIDDENGTRYSTLGLTTRELGHIKNLVGLIVDATYKDTFDILED